MGQLFELGLRIGKAVEQEECADAVVGDGGGNPGQVGTAGVRFVRFGELFVPIA